MARSKLLVRRKAFRRRSFVKDVKPGPGVELERIPATHVKATNFLIEDRGAPGRGPESIKVSRPGFMTDFAQRRGFLKKGKDITDMSNTKLRKMAVALADKVGPATALRMFQAQINFRARARGENLADRRKFEVGKEAIQRRFFSESK